MTSEIEPQTAHGVPWMMDARAGLLAAAPADVAGLVGGFLDRFAAESGLDALSLRWIDDARRRADLLTASQGVDHELPDEIEAAGIPWLWEKLVCGESVRLNAESDPPAGAGAECAWLAMAGMASSAWVPVHVDGVVAGFGLATTRRERVWSEAEIRELRDALAVVASELLRARAEVSRREVGVLLSRRVEFERFIAEIFARLQGVGPKDCESVIHECVGEAGEIFGVDWIVLRHTDALSGSSRLICSWTRPSLRRPVPKPTALDLPWLWARLSRGELFTAESRRDLPVDAWRERDDMREHGLESLIAIPLELDSRVSGFVLAGCAAQTKFEECSVEEMRLLALTLLGAHRQAKARLALSESEERYRRVVEDQSEFIVRWLPDGTRTFVNDSYCRFFERRREELVGTSFFPMVSEEHREQLRQRIASLSPSAPVSYGEHRVVAPHGGVAWQSWTDRAIFDGSGRVIELQSVGRDVTGRKLAEESLSRRASFQTLLAEISSRLLRSEPDAVPACIDVALERVAESHDVDRVILWSFDEELRVATAAHALERGCETSAPRVPLESRMVDRFSSEKAIVLGDCDGADTDAWIRPLLGPGHVQAGLILPIEVHGELGGVCSFVARRAERDWGPDDIEELRVLVGVIAHARAGAQAAKALTQRQTDLARTQRVAMVGSFEYDPRSGVYSLSKELRRVLHVSGDISTPADYARLVHPEDRPRFLAFMKKSADPRTNDREIEYRCVLHDDSVLHVRDTHEVDVDESGEVSAVFGTILDVTAQKRQEAELHRALGELRRLKEAAEDEAYSLRESAGLAPALSSLVAESPSFRRCLHLVERVAPTDATVLVLGETGTGKELIARSIHELSGRAEQSLVTINCAALPTNLIESELFGHERGAFTGAEVARPGKFELANDGTLFLDEIGDLPLELQSKLLRVLQEGEVERLGGSCTIQVDVRIIAATNRDLERAVAVGEFRADLFYRLNIFPISLPPLRERQGDIVLLAEHFVRKHSARLGRQVTSISSRMLDSLAVHSWPGNVRELENSIERALISSEGPVLDVPFSPQSGFAPAEPRSQRGRVALTLEGAERAHIEEVLEQTDWRIEGSDGAADRLGVPASTLRSKMKRLGVERQRDAEAE